MSSAGSSKYVDRQHLDFVILGAQKSASTALHTVLRSHPDVHMPRGETPYFEDPVFTTYSPAVLQRVIASAAPWQITGIRRPDYLGRPEVPDRLLQHSPGARLLVLLRDPVARAVSAYYWYMAHGLLPMSPADKGLVSLVERGHFEGFPRSGEVLGYGLYGQHLDRWTSRFPRGQILVLASDSVEDCARNAVAFLELGPGLPDGLGRRANEGTYDFRVIRALQAAHRLPPGVARRVAVAGVKRAGPFVLGDLLSRQPEVDESTRALLRDYYRRDLARLRAHTGGLDVRWVGEPAWLA